MHTEQILTSKHAREISHDGITWIHFDSFDQQDAILLRDHSGFHPLDIKDCLGEAQRAKIDLYNNYFFLVLEFPDYNNETRRLTTVEIDLFMTKNVLITIQKGRFKPLRQFFYRAKKNGRAKHGLFIGTAGMLLYHILDHLTAHTLTTVDKLAKDVKGVENEIYTTEGGAPMIRQLALLRRNILTLQRIIEPKRFVINTLVHLRTTHFPEELTVYFDDIHDRVEELWSYAMNTREVVYGLHAINESMVTYRTNEVIKALTIISAVLMPPTLIASIYGMNVRLPIAEGWFAFWLIITTIGVLIAGALIYIKRKEWL